MIRALFFCIFAFIKPVPTGVDALDLDGDGGGQRRMERGRRWMHRTRALLQDGGGADANANANTFDQDSMRWPSRLLRCLQVRPFPLGRHPSEAT